MPAFKFQQNNSLIVLGRGHKARGYELALGFSPDSGLLSSRNPTGAEPGLERAKAHYSLITNQFSAFIRTSLLTSHLHRHATMAQRTPEQIVLNDVLSNSR